MGFNFCGTIQKNHMGWCNDVQYAFKKRPRNFPRGDFKMPTATHNPSGQLRGTQVSSEMTAVTRREKNEMLTTVPCPGVVSMYLKNMGSVDRHDQLRLQPFLGLMGMVLVNGYIIHKSNARHQLQESSHSFRLHVHKMLHQNYLREVFLDVPNRSLAAGKGHELMQTTRARQRQCEVCSVYKPSHKKRGSTSTYYCPEISAGKRGLVTLCNKFHNHAENKG
ncbi:hypothetical protein PHMEG_00027275 [Phytophthora megakarya]|uniref:PiggyBac transposable element-derived protein domain-containing protein n=1 Tax=Phytophthora megakarya TaxID=4795 RepID=A0A225V660_9STRA|nr:hypothetical protein PHMEG_00027275 [Phytophthora megakarya]